jgi:hypothetical protein
MPRDFAADEPNQLPETVFEALAQAEHQALPLDGLSVFVRPLILRDVDACEALEAACFPPQERCSREKVTHVIQFSCSK